MHSLRNLSRLSLALLAGVGLAMGATATTHAAVKTRAPHAVAVAKAKDNAQSARANQSARTNNHDDQADAKANVKSSNQKSKLANSNSRKPARVNKSKVRDQTNETTHDYVHHEASRNGCKTMDYEETTDSRKSGRGSWTRRERIDRLTGHKSETVSRKGDHDHEAKAQSRAHAKNDHRKADRQNKNRRRTRKPKTDKNRSKAKRIAKYTPRQRKQIAKINVQLTKQMKAFANVRKPYHYAKLEINARDLGGYPTANHRYVVRADRLIRSNNLNRLTPAGAKILKNKLHVYEIIDLRDPHEIAREPDVGEFITKHKGHFDRYHLHIEREKFPVYSNQGHNRTNAAVAKDGEVYRYEGLFDTTPTAIRAYRNVFKKLLAKHPGAILYHCIEGRDRTGLVSVLILSALGVNRSDVMKDYLLTDYYSHKHPYFYQYNELNHFYSTIQHRYHGMHNYLTHVIGLTNGQLAKLRKQYLVKA